MLIRVVWGLALFFLGVFIGLIVTVADCLIIGSASFLAHITLWMLINTILATHVESSKRAMYWSVPVNLGYVISYYIGTSASFEGYARSLVVPLCALAILAPAYVYGVWVAKNEGGIYAFLLSLLCAGGTVFVNYLLNDEVSTFSIIIAILVCLFVGILPTKKLKITPAPHPAVESSSEDIIPVRETPTRGTARPTRRERERLEAADDDAAVAVEAEGAQPRQVRLAEENVYEQEVAKPRNNRPTKRAKTATKRTRTPQVEQVPEEEKREARRASADSRETRRTADDRGSSRRVVDDRGSNRRVVDDRVARNGASERRARSSRDVPPEPSRPATLGNTQTPTRSRRNVS